MAVVGCCNVAKSAQIIEKARLLVKKMVTVLRIRSLYDLQYEYPDGNGRIIIAPANHDD